MASAIEVLVPIPRRWAGERRGSAARPPRTRDLRVIALMCGLGILFWVGIAWAAVALLA